MNRNRLILILTFILTIVTLGCGLFSSKTGDAEVLFPSTEIGTPEGNKVTTDIGPAGGILSSPDSRLTLTVPPNALTETIAFTIQPITIVDRGYRATGESHDEIYSGNVCDLEKDFTVKGTGLASFDFNFAPSSGKVSYTTAYNAGGLGVQEVSTGTYKIASDGADGFDILLDLAGTAHTSRGDFSGDAGIKIHLTPLTGNECGGQSPY